MAEVVRVNGDRVKGRGHGKEGEAELGLQDIKKGDLVRLRER